MLTRRRTLQLAASALAPALLGRTAFAQAWPNRPVRIIVPFRPAAAATRSPSSARKLTEIWGQQICRREQGGAGKSGI